MPKKNNHLRSPLTVSPLGSLVEQSLKVKRGMVLIIVLTLGFGCAALYLRQSYLKDIDNLIATKNSIRATSFFLTETARPSATPVSTITKFINTPKSTPTVVVSTVQPICSSVTVTSNNTSKGVFLHITPCLGTLYDLGPFPMGSYKVAPSNKFIIYVAADYDGSVYIAKIGETILVRLGKLRQDHKFRAFIKSETPSFLLTISDSWVTIYEEKFKESASYEIPSKYSK